MSEDVLEEIVSGAVPEEVKKRKKGRPKGSPNKPKRIKIRWGRRMKELKAKQEALEELYIRGIRTEYYEGFCDAVRIMEKDLQWK